jgi:hypothetical protein
LGDEKSIYEIRAIGERERKERWAGGMRGCVCVSVCGRAREEEAEREREREREREGEGEIVVSLRWVVVREKISAPQGCF